MKKIITKICTLCLCLSVLLGCLFISSCSGKKVMTLEGGYALDADVFKWLVSFCKTEEYSNLLSVLEQNGQDPSMYDLTVYQLWESEIGEEGKSLAETVMEKAVILGKSYLSAAKQYDEQGFGWGKAEREAIDTALAAMEQNIQKANNKSLKQFLKDYGFKLSTYEKVLEYQYKTSALLTRFTSPGARYEITDEDVEKAFDPTVKAFGFSNVNHVFLYSITFNSAGNPVELSEENYNAVKDKAREVYEAVISGEAQFEEFLQMSDDQYSPDGYLVNINTAMTDVFVENAIAMQVGEVRLFESEGIGFHIMKKYEFTDEQRTEIEDFIRENLEAEAEERILNKYYDSVVTDEELIASYDAVHADILL